MSSRSRSRRPDGARPLRQPLLISRRLAIAAVAIAALLAVVGLIAIDPIQQYDEFKAPPSTDGLASGDVGLLRGGGSGRYQFWETAVDAFAGDPIGGVGASGYTPYWFEHREIPIPATRAHSVLFETLAELGIVGLGLLLASSGPPCTAASAARAPRRRSPRSARRWRCWSSASPPRPSTGPGTCRPCSGSRSSPRRCSPARRPSAARTRDRRRASRATRRRRRGFAGGVALLLVAWISICGVGPVVALRPLARLEPADAADGDVEAAISAANDAIDLQPWSAEPRTQLALVYEQEGDYAKAREAIAEAVSARPTTTACTCSRRGWRPRTVTTPRRDAALLTAHELNPRDPAIVQELAASS